MKNLIKRLYNVPLIVIFLSILAFTSASDSLINDIASAIRQGRATEVSRYFGDSVDLTLPGTEGTYSKAQAEVLLRNFFAANTPTSLSVAHNGSSRDGSFFAILNMQTKAGSSFRVYVLLKKVSDNFVLHQIKFEPQ